MALLSRVRERIETDLSDAELQDMIDGVVEEIENRFGPNAAIEVHIGVGEGAGDRQFLPLDRPIDTSQALTVTEINGTEETVLDTSDFLLRDGGRLIQRLSTGTNPCRWWASLVKVNYTPQSDAKQREEAVIQVVQLEIQSRGLTSERAGDWQAQYADLVNEREKLIASLAPRRGLALA